MTRVPDARGAAASPNAPNSARENGLRMACHSGCHCTASAKPGALRTRKPSISPSGPRASTSSRAPSCCTPCECSELTMMRSLPARPRSMPPCTSSTSCAGPYCTSSGRPCPRGGRACRALPAPSARACRQTRRSSPGSRGRCRAAAGRPRRLRDQRQRRLVAMRVVQCAGLARRPRIAVRLDVRWAARQQDAVEPTMNSSRSTWSPSDGISTGMARPPRAPR